MPYRVELMATDDIAEVATVERRCFANPWPPSAYRRELRDPERNYYIVLRWDDGGPPPAPERPWALLPLFSFGKRDEGDSRSRIVGFAGLWIMLDEAHITTIGVSPEHRRRSLGEMLFVALVEEAVRRGARWVTLEVRVSNEPAQTLYKKYGFRVQGRRKNYYSDNNEDAYIMWSPELDDAAVIARYRALRDDLDRRAAHWEVSLPLSRKGVE